MTDHAILQLFINRIEKAIEEIDKKYHNLCFSTAFHLLRQHEDTEECVEDTWMTCWVRKL